MCNKDKLMYSFAKNRKICKICIQQIHNMEKEQIALIIDLMHKGTVTPSTYILEKYSLPKATYLIKYVSKEYIYLQSKIIYKIPIWESMKLVNQ